MSASSRPATARKSDPRRRHTCDPEQVLELLRRMQSGDVAAEHALHEVFTPMVAAAIARYRDDAWLSDDLVGEAYVILHRLLLQFDTSRGVSLFTYLQKMLPAHLGSSTRGGQRERDRELKPSMLLGAPAEEEEDTDVEAALDRLMRQDCRWLQSNVPVEEVVVLNLTISAALEKLPERQQRVFALWRAGYSFEEIAQELGMTAAACRQAWHRVKLVLQVAMKEDS